MRKIEKRSIFCLILAALLGLGLAFFCFRFVVDGGDWASYPYNRHLRRHRDDPSGGRRCRRDNWNLLSPRHHRGGWRKP